MLPLEHSEILLTFIKLLVNKIFILSIFEWLFYTSFTVFHNLTLKLLLYMEVELMIGSGGLHIADSTCMVLIQY